MENVNGKEIPLQYVTVKLPGQRPRGSRSILSLQKANPVPVAAGADPEAPKEAAGTPSSKKRQLRSSSQGSRPTHHHHDREGALVTFITDWDFARL